MLHRRRRQRHHRRRRRRRHRDLLPAAGRSTRSRPRRRPDDGHGRRRRTRRHRHHHQRRSPAVQQRQRPDRLRKLGEPGRPLRQQAVLRRAGQLADHADGVGDDFVKIGSDLLRSPDRPRRRNQRYRDSRPDRRIHAQPPQRRAPGRQRRQRLRRPGQQRQAGMSIDMGGGNDNVNLANGSNSLSVTNVENLNGSDFAAGSVSNDTLTLLNDVVRPDRQPRQGHQHPESRGGIELADRHLQRPARQRHRIATTR